MKILSTIERGVEDPNNILQREIGSFPVKQLQKILCVTVENSI